MVLWVPAKVFLNNFHLVPDSCHREEGKSSRKLFEKVRVRFNATKLLASAVHRELTLLFPRCKPWRKQSGKHVSILKQCWPFLTLCCGASVVLQGNEKSARNVSDRSFFLWTSARLARAKMLVFFFQELEGLTEVFGRICARMSVVQPKTSSLGRFFVSDLRAQNRK